MANGQLRAAIGQLRRLIRPQGGCPLSDGQLLEAFISRGDQASFEVLVWRHATMVLSLCQRILRDSHAAEDGFQATFLVLARKAGSIGKRDAVASWLYKVAYRAALRLRTRARHEVREEVVEELPARELIDDSAWRDLRPMLDEEIAGLPEKYRAPLVLCYLQGRTNAEAAKQLGCPKGTILSRLARGRQRLRLRLARRGVALSALAAVTALSQQASAASPVPALVSSTITAAIPFAAGKAVTGLVSTPVAALTEGVLKAMFVTKCKIAAALLALAILVPGATLLAGGGRGDRPAPQREETLAALAGENAAREEEGADEEKLTETAGKVIGVAKDGRTFTLEVPPQTRGEEPKKFDIPIGEKTHVSYFGVGPGSAKLSEGYTVRIWRVEGKEVPAFVQFTGNAKDLFRRQADVRGRVESVSSDGKLLTFQIPPRTPEERERREPIKVDVRVTGKSLVLYSWIAKGGSKPTEGYSAEVWLERGSKDEVARVAFEGHEPRPERGVPEKQPEWNGKVAAAAADGKSFTVEVAPMVRGAAAAKQEIKIDDKTQVTYLSVGPDGEKPSVGHLARVWLADVTKENAARVVFRGVPKERWEVVEGKVVAVAADGKSITLEFQSRERREPPKRVDYKLTEKANLIFHGVEPDGAKLKEGYIGRVYLEDGAKDVAAQVDLINPGTVRPGGRR
jgi:RNA polymerase sigma factor (sigma-70 family)